ncbi:hypothetical protein HYDPIDRAFT_106611, partial [Hydnomerulius pinastri MD-312]
MAQSLKEGASIGRVVAKVEDALTGLYHAKGFDKKDLDIATIVYRLGGRKLLYALSKHIGIPSIRTLRRSSVFTKIMPSCGAPTIDEVSFNIREGITSKFPAFTGSPTTDSRPTFRSGMLIFWDEVSQEEAACYLPQSDSVGGLCREHSHCVDTRLTTFESAESLARALAEGVVHLGKEASVIAMGSYDKALRGTLPVLVSPTCKSESPDESGIILKMVIEAWNREGATRFGPVWSVASDGDAGRRAMAYKLFLVNEIDSRHKLYKYLGRLPGLNLRVGVGDVTPNVDWKHEIKRFARAFRSEEGVIINNTVINCHTLRRHFSRDPKFTEAAIDRLLDPSDPQDVPRAIELLEAINSIANLPTEGCTPA